MPRLILVSTESDRPPEAPQGEDVAQAPASHSTRPPLDDTGTEATFSSALPLLPRVRPPAKIAASEDAARIAPATVADFTSPAGPPSQRMDALPVFATAEGADAEPPTRPPLHPMPASQPPGYDDTQGELTLPGLPDEAPIPIAPAPTSAPRALPQPSPLLPIDRAVHQLVVEAGGAAVLREGVAPIAWLDALLLDAEVLSGYSAPFAQLGLLEGWRDAVVLSSGGVGRDPVRALRLIEGLSGTDDGVQRAPLATTASIVEVLGRLLAHPRLSVWSRAARLLGRFAHLLPGAPGVIEFALQQPVQNPVRRRAITALAALGPTAPARLRGQLDSARGQRTESSVSAALALGLMDRVRLEPEGWLDLAHQLATYGGPETWATLLRSLRAIGLRHAHHRGVIERLVVEIQDYADAMERRPETDRELLERTRSLASHLPWVASYDEGARTAQAAIAQLIPCVLHMPDDPALGPTVDAIVASCEQTLSAAVRASAGDDARAVLRAAVHLEDVADLLIDGDLAILAARIESTEMRTVSLARIESLRTRLHRVATKALRRPTPELLPWRRFLVRASANLARIPPIDGTADTVDVAVARQASEALSAIAEDVTLRVPSLQRSVQSALTEITEALRPVLGDAAAPCIFAWMTLRDGLLPPRARSGRPGDTASTDALDVLQRALDASSKPGGGDEVLSLLVGLVPVDVRLGALLGSLVQALDVAAQTAAGEHWSGLPQVDFTPLAQIADDLERARRDPAYALSPAGGLSMPTEGPLGARAQQLNRSLMGASLTFLDAARRAEFTDGYVGECASLTEALAQAAGPVLGTVLRARLARRFVALRSHARAIGRERGESVRYVGRLKVLGPLTSADEGGMASTFLAEGPAPGKRVVLKLLPRDRFAGADAAAARTLFEREMQRLAAIVHPNVCGLVDAGFVDEGAYLAIEYIPGASLQSLVERTGPIHPRRLVPIVTDTARGLAHLHRRGIVHRDVKPANVLVQFDREAGDALTPERWASADVVRGVVIDLGIAFDLESGAQAHPSQEGLVGTPGYLAPEIARGSSHGETAADVYALSVVTFEALAGYNPFLVDNPPIETVVVRHAMNELPVDRLRTLGLPHAACELLTEAASLKSEERPTMAQFAARWTRAFQGMV